MENKNAKAKLSFASTYSVALAVYTHSECTKIQISTTDNILSMGIGAVMKALILAKILCKYKWISKYHFYDLKIFCNNLSRWLTVLKCSVRQQTTDHQ